MLGDRTESISFDYQQYIGLGAAVVSRNTFKWLGHIGKSSPRELKLDTMSRKREIPNSDAVKKQRAKKLVNLDVKHLPGEIELSACSEPDWLSEANRLEREADEDEANVLFLACRGNGEDMIECFVVAIVTTPPSSPSQRLRWVDMELSDASTGQAVYAEVALCRIMVLK